MLYIYTILYTIHVLYTYLCVYYTCILYYILHMHTIHIYYKILVLYVCIVFYFQWPLVYLLHTCFSAQRYIHKLLWRLIDCFPHKCGWVVPTIKLLIFGATNFNWFANSALTNTNVFGELKSLISLTSKNSWWPHTSWKHRRPRLRHMGLYRWQYWSPDSLRKHYTHQCHQLALFLDSGI